MPALRMAFYRRVDDSPLLGSQLAGSVVPWILDAVACPARCHHALLERRERAGLKVAAPNAPRAVISAADGRASSAGRL